MLLEPLLERGSMRILHQCSYIWNCWTSRKCIYTAYNYLCINITKGSCLRFFSDLYVWNNSVHEYETRQQNLLHVPLIFTKPLSKSVRISGVTLYNHFSNLLCLTVSYVTYKGTLKRYIIDNDTKNLVWTSWIDLPKYWWFHNYHFFRRYLYLYTMTINDLV